MANRDYYLSRANECTILAGIVASGVERDGYEHLAVLYRVLALMKDPGIASWLRTGTTSAR